MKFSATILILVLFLLFNVNYSNAQIKNAELEKLEALLKQLDKESDSIDVEVDVDGDKTSGKLEITVKREVPVQRILKLPKSTGIQKIETISMKEKSVIDLSKIDVTDEYINERIKAASSNPRCGSIPGVVLTQVDTSQNYMLVHDYNYNSGAFSITVFKGYIYDRASIPSIFWGIGMDKDSLGNVAPLIHDIIYRNEGELPKNQVLPYKKFNREETDKMFLQIMEKCGVSKWRRIVAYQIVREFAGYAWKKQ